MNNLEQEATKIHKIICSCLNKDQLNVANNMLKLFFKKWDYKLRYTKNHQYVYWCGQFMGLIQGRLMEFNKEWKPNYKDEI